MFDQRAHVCLRARDLSYDEQGGLEGWTAHWSPFNKSLESPLAHNRATGYAIWLPNETQHR